MRKTLCAISSHPATRHPRIPRCHQRLSATSLNGAGIEWGGGLGGCRLGLLVPGERPPARQPVSEPLKASNAPGGFSGDIHPSRKAPAESWDGAVLKTPRQPSASAPRPALDPAKSAWVPEIGTGGHIGGGEELPRRAISWESSPVLRATASNRSRSLMGAISWESGNLGTDTDWGTPVANAASRERGKQPAARVADGQTRSRPRGVPAAAKLRRRK